MKLFLISDVLLGYRSKLIHNHNMDTETFDPDVRIYDVLLGYLSEQLQNHNMDTETFFQDAQITDVLLGYLSELPYNHTVIFGPNAQISGFFQGYL